MFETNFIPVEDVIVRREVADTHFSCDLSVCKGACCTLESDYGAPLLEEEVELMHRAYPEAKKYLSQEHIDAIERSGFYEVKDGEILTKSIDSKACVFVYYDGDIAKCSLEKAYFNGETNFRKPVSCHLFPIRVSRFGGDVLRYEKFSECSAALKKGKQENVTVAEFCKDSLERLYGVKWYQKFIETIGK